MRWIWFGVAVAFASPALAQRPAERDWAAALRADARALHDEIAANHPGAVNPEDPGFAKRNDAQLAMALKRARTARTYADYYLPLREYVAAFNDGHMTIRIFGDAPSEYRWPGFLTNYDAQGKMRVHTRADDAPVPIGAELVGCDGRSAEKLAADRIGRMWGRWQLESTRQRWGRTLFLDEHNIAVPPLARCTFRVDGRQRTIALEWKPIDSNGFWERAWGDRKTEARIFEARTLADGTRWYAMPSFNGDAQSDAGKALPGVIAAMQADRNAPAIVLDLRRNNGGSSDWSQQIAQTLWGQAAIDGLPKSDTQVDWRVSAANLASIEESYAKRGDGVSPEAKRWFEAVIAGLKGGLARGDKLWREAGTEDDAPKAGKAMPQPPLKAHVYLLTDPGCASACLDAVDLWRALGATHVGKTTSADTLYMDVRQYRLPSGIAGGGMPMKVYRGRSRGNNEPVVPVRKFDGDIADTPAVEAWIMALEHAAPR